MGPPFRADPRLCSEAGAGSCALPVRVIHYWDPLHEHQEEMLSSCQGSPGRGMSLQAQCHVTPHLLSYAMNLVGRRSYEYGSFRDTAHQQIKKANMGPRGSVTSCRLGAVTGGTPAPAQALPNGFA